MNNKINIVLDAISNSFFIATNLEDVEGLLKLGVVKKGIFSRGAAKLRKYMGENCLVYEDISGRREYTISELFPKITREIDKRIYDTPYLWTFRPYPWLDQFQALNIEPLSWNYYAYTYWSSKLLQDKLLLKNSDAVLEKHLLNKHKSLNRRFRTKYHPEVKGNGIVISKSYSTGGSGVYWDSSQEEFKEDLVLRLEKKIAEHIPVCQVAFTDGDSTLCYPPSTMIIREGEGNFDYVGGDFSSNYLPDYVEDYMNKITRSVGRVLNSAGFEGVYNCDYIFNPNTKEIFFTEVNPRNSGSSFLIDSALADQYINGDERAILLMPTFLSFYSKKYDGVPKNLDRDLGFSEVFSAPSNSSFMYHRAYGNIIASNDNNYHPPAGIKIKKGQLEGTECFPHKIISSPLVPTSLHY